MAKAKQKELVLTVKAVKIGPAWIAATEVGGITVRGGRCDGELEAVQSCLLTLGNPRDDEAAVGLSLALDGLTAATFATGPTSSPALDSGTDTASGAD